MDSSKYRPDQVHGPLEAEEKNNGASPEKPNGSGITSNVEETNNGNTKHENTANQDGEAWSPPHISLIQLFRFSKGLDYILLVLGILSAWVSAFCMPGLLVLLGRLSNILVGFSAQSEMDSCTSSNNVSRSNDTSGISNQTGLHVISEDDFYDEMKVFGISLTVISVVQWLFNYTMVACLNTAAERQVFHIRSLFLRAMMRQEIAWYDGHHAGEFASRTSEDLVKLQDGIGEKIGMLHYFFGTSLISIILAFVYGWKLTLVTLSVTPLMFAASALLGKTMTTLSEREMKAYAKAGGVAEEVLSAIRTVIAFGGETREVQRYTTKLELATKAGIRRGLLTALGTASFWCIIYGSYALAFWYGSQLIIEDRGQLEPDYDPSKLLVIFFSVLISAMYMGQSSPYAEAIVQAKGAASSIFAVIDRVPPIDSSSEKGLKPEKIVGTIEFKEIHFSYPNRPDVTILKGLNLKISKGETVALVGESGCGKSTSIHLLQRFYDPLDGTVMLDNCDIRLLNLGWLREHMGIVNQEPVLFGTTIADNIRYGRDGTTQEDIERAAKEANAHDFIWKLPKKYETVVGDRGTQLSGGQRQRVAIARALIRNPRILLLDEATSALDSESEAVVQEALEKARQGRTTVVVAHRLSTIRNADKIAVFSEGRVAELGTHDQLMSQKGMYYTLATTQLGKSKETEEGVPTPKHGEVIRERHLIRRSMSTQSDNSVTEIVRRTSNALSRSPSVRGSKYIPFTENLKSETDSIMNDEEDEEKKNTPPMMRILKENQPEWPYILVGCIGTVVMSFALPVYALMFGDILKVLSYCDDEQAKADTVFYSCMFLVIGIGSFIATFLQLFMFAYAGEYLTRRLRIVTFSAMLKQEMGWFDDSRNSIGALCTRLSSDAANVQGATGSKIGTILQSIITIGAAVVISLFLSWKLTLATICFVPGVLIAAYLQNKIMMSQTVVELKSLDRANKIAIEAISNIRTVASLHREVTFHSMYMQNLVEPHKKALRNSHIRGLVYGFAQSIPFFAYVACMFYGSYLVLHEDMDYSRVFKVSELLIYGTISVGQAFAFAPNASKGAVSAARIFKLLERKPLIDSTTESGLKLNQDTLGEVEFKDVKFNYPARPDVPVIRGLNLKVKSGQVLALVGSSGCGKSTCIQLLERFYDPAGGHVAMDNTDIAQLNVRWLRSRIGIVSQEPILFDRSIAENIAYGDNSRQVPMDEIIDAAVKANIHKFISALPQGYETSVGDKGAQLSGGQKQRIAIARALVRNPKILLLDEATSALDTESEKVVQEALEHAQKGRTCITVAHRLTTIKDADQIAVIDQGRVVEMGTHDELMQQQGHYYRFYSTQSKGF